MIVTMSTQDYEHMSPKFIYILLVSDESGNLSLKVFLEKECGNIKNPMRWEYKDVKVSHLPGSATVFHLS
jgi:hypothetical protein